MLCSVFLLRAERAHIANSSEHTHGPNLGVKKEELIEPDIHTITN